MYTLIVKGDVTAAATACNLHLVQVSTIARHTQFDECIITTPAHADSMTVLNNWFCEHNGIPPAPAGTLMWFGPLFKRMRDGKPVVPPHGWDIIEGGKESNHA